MSEKTILVEKRDGIAILTLNRPPLNPLNKAVFSELNDIASVLDSDSKVKAVIITGSGDKAFAAGADITEISNFSPLEMYEFNVLARAALANFENLGKPTIAAIRGLALGGGYELALTCDFRIAAESAKIGQIGRAHV